MSERLPTFSVHVHCTACGGSGLLGGTDCHCITDDPEVSDAVCEHGIGFDETCEWCDYEEDGPQDLETTLDNALDRASQRR